MRSLPILLALATAAGAAPAYPVTLAKASAAELAKREADFRARNPEHWVELRFDAYGHLAFAKTDDAALVAADAAALRDLARRDADFLGMDPRRADRLATTNGVSEIVDDRDGIVRGQVVFSIETVAGRRYRTINALFFVETPLAVAADDVAKRLDGKTYTLEVAYGHPPHLDCAMGPHGGNCAATKVGSTRREVTLAARDVAVQTILWRDHDALRFVRCVDLATLAAPPPDASWHDVVPIGRTLIAKQGAPALPLVVDAVTGQVLTPGPARCDALRNFR